MTKIKWILLLAGITGVGNGCSSKKAPVVSTADFALGKIKMISSVKEQQDAHELTVITKFELKKDNMGPDLNTYFQYQLGDKIKLLIGTDTIKPALSYYVPLINELEKEIDSKYVLQTKDLDKPRRVIIHDSILDFNKVDISLK